ncbi:MAG TPA: MltA domain-containing protein [Dongiaceae bacterium]|nr:MltA domain-containing protein [Dongiaceae bacterium]
MAPRGWRHWLAHLRAWVAVTGLVGLAACETTGTAPNQAALPPPGNLLLEPASFDALPGWGSDRLSEAWPALLKSCAAIGQLPAAQPLGPEGIAGTPQDWHNPCAQARQLPAANEPALRRFVEAAFRPFRARDSNGRPGFFTAYYEPELEGSLTPSALYHVPLYRLPPQPVSYSRQQIDEGILAGQHLELVWVTDPVDAFLLQIQGSGRIRLPDGRIQRIGYAGDNGQKFGAIGKMMIDAGLVDREHASMQSIRAWLKAHPQEAVGWMQKNPRYIFFRPITGDGPVGAESLPLTPGRSLAVDTSFLALGLPLWLDTTWPVDLGTARKGDPLQRLMVAQDVGSAIKGPVRGDIFWGSGEPALTFAGSMKNSGSYYVFLPVTVASRREPVISDVTTP